VVIPPKQGNAVSPDYFSSPVTTAFVRSTWQADE